MVGKNPTPGPAMVPTILARLDSERDRFLVAVPPPIGGVTYDRQGLAELVAEIVFEHITDLHACCDASEDAVLELLHDLEGGAR